MNSLVWLVAALGTVLVYELLRFFLVRRLRGAIHARAAEFVRSHRIQLESARFIDRVWMREAMAQDARIDAAVAASARATGDSVLVLRDRVDAYVNEIAPYFSMSAYYWFGEALSRRIVNFTFELVMAPGDFDAQLAKAPEGAIRVYVMNHRANMDPLILAYGLLNKVPMSYAVGEWALVWPLDWLFRSFGGYFVRRGEKDPLYHAVLERYVQLLAGNGAVTGFFIEGGLSRDGALRRPRSGLLDYIIKLRLDWPDREIVFMPVGLNYDRVFEDAYLSRERDGAVAKPSRLERLVGLAKAVVYDGPLLIGANLFKLALRSHKKYGYAAIAFGEPLALSDWPGGAELHSLPDETRRDAVRALASELLERRIAAVVPATPVPILCAALEQAGGAERDAVVARVRDVLDALERVGAPIALGQAFNSIRRRRETPEIESMPGSGLDEAVLDDEEAEQITLRASTMLRRRGLLRIEAGPGGGRLEVNPEQAHLISYYANAIRHHLQG